jgi:hypothetical protein
MYECGRAGAFVSGQKWRRRGLATLNAAVAAALAVVAVGGFATVASSRILILRALCAVAAIGATLGCVHGVVRARRALRRAAQAAVGARSERQVQAAVRRTGAVAAAYGLTLGGRGGDCDAVVFTGGCGAVAVEVKTGHGEVTVAGEEMRVGRRTLANSPVRQAMVQSRRLSRHLDRRAVLAVVCVPGMTNRPFTTSDGVWVCGVRDLAAVLARAPRVFASGDEARQAMRRLWKTNQE